MEKVQAVARLQEAAHKDDEEALKLINWLAADIHAIEYGIGRGDSIGRYNDELRYMRTYIERLTRIGIESFGCEKAIEALEKIEG